MRVRQVKEFYVYLGAALTIFSFIPVRWTLVQNLKKKRPDLWQRFGSPKGFERDNFLRKYPYRGGREVYKDADRADRALLIIYALLHAVFLIFSGITLLI